MVLGWVCQFAYERKATHVIPCFDTGKSFRYKIYKAYKGNRPKIEEGDSSPSEYLLTTMSVLQATGLTPLCKKTFEADDLLATIAASADADVLVEIVTQDKDNFQCISKYCKQIRPGVMGRPDVVWDLKMLLKETGFTPKQFLDYQTLIGDKSTDNIPSILTPAKAKKIVLENGSLVKYLNQDQEFSRANEKDLLRNRKLVRLVKNCVEIDLEKYDVRLVRKGLSHKSKFYQQLTQTKKTLF